MKRLVVISDLHCGHALGLTHPDYDPNDGLSALRNEYWKFYAETIADLQPIDVLLINGDSIDGSGERSGGTELLTSDRLKQVEMAEAAIRLANAETIRLTYGTNYHTGVQEDFEDVLANNLNAIIQSHAIFDVNGVVFDVRHHVGGSQSPMNRSAQITKERIWNLLWATRGERPQADIVIRSHVHYFGFVGDTEWLGVTTPALQGHGSKYGQRRMTGTVDFGLLSFDVDNEENWTWDYHIFRAKRARVVAEKL